MTAPSRPAPGRDASARVAIVTLGCGRNEVDTDQLAGLLTRDGMQIVTEAGDADVVLVNTCTFIAPAKRESVDTVLAACDLKDQDAVGVVVVGCMAQRYPQELADAIPEADAVVGFAGYPALPGLVEAIMAGRPHDRVVGIDDTRPVARRQLPVVQVASAATTAPTPAAPWLATVPEASDDEPVAMRRTAQDDLDQVPATGPRFPVRALSAPGRPWAYLKIASGCDRRCTFCAIPSFRGRFRSRPMEEILVEAGWLAAQGVRELVLVSENTTSWGKDLPGGRDGAPTLLSELAAVDGIERIRLMYLQPDELRPALLEAVAATPKVAPYFDLSLQHVSAPVLGRMARAGSPAAFGALIDRIRAITPHATFRSNFILGFPGETAQDVAALETFLDRHELDWVGLFAFSREDGTPSAQLPDQIDGDLARVRVERLAAVQERAADAAARRWIGRTVDVLVESHVRDVAAGDQDAMLVEVAGRGPREAPDTDGEIQLRTDDGAPAPVAVGEMVRARVEAADGVDLVARVSAR